MGDKMVKNHKKQPEDNIDPDLLSRYFKNISRLLTELTYGWTTDDIKLFISDLDSFNLWNQYKTYKELSLSYIYLLSSHGSIKILEDRYAGLNKQIIELERTSSEIMEKKAETDRYIKVIKEKNFIIHLKEPFPKIYNKILELEKNDLAEFKMEYINLNITQNNFAEIVANNGYDQSFLIFLPKFRIKGNEIDRKSFISACSNAK
jgi:hypothetical protein